MSKAITTILIIGALIGGYLLGAYLTQEAVVDEMKRWERASLYEDGSWRVVYRDGTFNNGCIEGGICND